MKSSEDINESVTTRIQSAVSVDSSSLPLGLQTPSIRQPLKTDSMDKLSCLHHSETTEHSSLNAPQHHQLGPCSSGFSDTHVVTDRSSYIEKLICQLNSLQGSKFDHILIELQNTLQVNADFQEDFIRWDGLQKILACPNLMKESWMITLNVIKVIIANEYGLNYVSDHSLCLEFLFKCIFNADEYCSNVATIVLVNILDNAKISMKKVTSALVSAYAHEKQVSADIATSELMVSKSNTMMMQLITFAKKVLRTFINNEVFTSSFGDDDSAFTDEILTNSSSTLGGVKCTKTTAYLTAFKAMLWIESAVKLFYSLEKNSNVLWDTFLQVGSKSDHEYKIVTESQADMEEKKSSVISMSSQSVTSDKYSESGSNILESDSKADEASNLVTNLIPQSPTNMQNNCDTHENCEHIGGRSKGLSSNRRVQSTIINHSEELFAKSDKRTFTRSLSFGETEAPPRVEELDFDNHLKSLLEQYQPWKLDESSQKQPELPLLVDSTSTSLTVPPPPPPCPPPPPKAPPAPSNWQSNSSNNKSISSNLVSKRMPNQSAPPKSYIQFYWSEITKNTWNKEVQNTIWDSVIPIPINCEKVKSLFEVKSLTTKCEDHVTAPTTKLISILPTKRAQHVEITISKLPRINIIKTSLIEFDFKLLNKEILEKISSVLPTDEEVKLIENAIRNSNGLVLRDSERFMIEISKIPCYRERVKLMLFIIDYDSLEKDVCNVLEDVKTSMEQIKSSNLLKIILGAYLSFGNLLNRHKNVVAFKIDFLKTSLEIRDSIEKRPLLYHICSEILACHPESSDLYSEIGIISICSRADCDEISTVLSSIKTNMKSSVEYFKMIVKEYPCTFETQRLNDKLLDIYKRYAYFIHKHGLVMQKFREFLQYLGYTAEEATGIKTTEFYQWLMKFAIEYRTQRNQILCTKLALERSAVKEKQEMPKSPLLHRRLETNSSNVMSQKGFCSMRSFSTIEGSIAQIADTWSTEEQNINTIKNSPRSHKKYFFSKSRIKRTIVPKPQDVIKYVSLPLDLNSERK